jgi:hypothetical protein
VIVKSMVVYQGGDEVIVTTLENEKETLQAYFGPKMGRSLEDYERSVTNEPAVNVTVNAIRMRVNI